MANSYYTSGRATRAGWILADTVPGAITVCVIGVSSDYVFNASHNDLADVNPDHITMPEETLASVTNTLGMLDAADLTAEGLTDDEIIDALIVYLRWTGGESFIAYLDSAADGSLPQTISGSKAQINWDADGIVRI